MPAGPAPTTTTPAPPRGTSSAIRSATCSPCSMAFRMSPMPQSSPTTCTPGREDSKCASTSGRSIPRSAVPNTSRIAFTGHSAAQRPWPMQCSACTSRAAPSTMPRMSPSGHAFRHERLPMQTFGSMTGWSERGTDAPRLARRRSASASRCCRTWRRRRCPIARKPTSTSEPVAMAADARSMIRFGRSGARSAESLRCPRSTRPLGRGNPPRLLHAGFMLPCQPRRDASSSGLERADAPGWPPRPGRSRSRRGSAALLSQPHLTTSGEPSRPRRARTCGVRQAPADPPQSPAFPSGSPRAAACWGGRSA